MREPNHDLHFFEKHAKFKKSGRPNRFSKFRKKLTKWLKKMRSKPTIDFFTKPKQKTKNEGDQTDKKLIWKKHASFRKIWEAKPFLQILEKADQMITKRKTGTKIKFPAKPKQQTEKWREPNQNLVFFETRTCKVWKFLEAEPVLQILETAEHFFLLESTTKFVSPENWWFKRVLQNVRLPTSMQDLIWFPEVFRIVFRFERSWESSQEPLKYDLTVENYSRKEKRCAWRIQGTFSFLRLSFSRLDVGKLLYFRLKLKFQSLNLNWQK